MIVGTLGKALGSYGAYVCGSRALVDYLVNEARPLIFSTAPPPPAIAAALTALELLCEQPRRVEKLQANAAEMRAALAREGVSMPPARTHVMPLLVGDAQASVAVTAAALERGVFVQAIRPPSVPPDSFRGCGSPSSHRTARASCSRGAAAIAEAARELGVAFRAQPPTPSAAAIGHAA